MSHDSSHRGTLPPGARNGRRARGLPAVAFEPAPPFDRRMDGKASSGRQDDEPAGPADDALMRCYNG